MRQARHVVLRAQLLDLRERIVQMTTLDNFAGFFHFQLVATQAINAFRRQADDRIATPRRAALDGFEQKCIRPIGQFQIHRQGRVQVGKHFTHQRDAGVSLRS